MHRGNENANCPSEGSVPNPSDPVLLELATVRLQVQKLVADIESLQSSQKSLHDRLLNVERRLQLLGRDIKWVKWVMATIVVAILIAAAL